jgi:Carboxypeptidase regulatory-like domain/TonB-dependent Receptor Plug Domain
MGHSRSVVIALISLAASVRAPADFHQPAPWRPARWAGPIADTAAVLAGTLVDADADRAVPYGTVALLGTEWAAFADANGAFRLGGLPAGTYIVRARQIGYTPKDTTVVIAPAPAITTLTFHMHRIPALLKLVKVEGHRSGRCVNTGIPDSTIDLPLARIFTQVGENVDRFRLLADAYPYRYRRVERNLLRSDPGGDSTTSTDTVSYESRSKRPYRLGGVIYEDADDGGHRRQYMYLPAFRDLADPGFLTLHCFSYGSTEAAGGNRVIRIDFRPADTITVPDVEGSIYLDSTRLIVRRAVFRMTKPERASSPIMGLTVTATYREVVPLIPVVDSLVTDQPMPSVARSFSSAPRQRTAIEEARLLDYVFEPRVADGAPLGAAVPVRDTSASRAVLAGRVLQSDGIPVGHAVVALLGTRDTAVTTGDGHFVLRTATPGTYMVSVLGLGLRPERFVATLSQRPERDLLISMDRSIPVLATVTTTTDPARSGQTGFDKRRAMGVGQFLTYDQIQSKHAAAFTQLLQTLGGVSVTSSSLQPGGATTGSRGPGSCVSYIVDGVPQLQLMEHTVDNGPIGGESPDNLIDVSQVGAVEVYSSAERPAEFQSSQEHPVLPGAPLPRVGLDRQQCALVVVWTKSRIGVPAGGTLAKSATTGDETRVDAVFGDDSACGTRPVSSTVDAVIYVTIQGVPSRPVPDSVWSEYTGRVMRAVHRWAVLPSELTLPSFGVVDAKRAADSAGPRRAHQMRDVAPTLSSVIGFTIDSAGALVEAHVAASSLSGAADTSMLVMLAQAAAAHDFPPVPSSATGSGPARFSLVVASGEPPPGAQAAVIGRISVPVWHQSRAARLVPQPRRGDAAPVRGGAAGAGGVDSVTVEAVIDAQGRAETTTARVIRRAGSPATDASASGIDVRAGQVLSSLRFEPAQIAGCPIAELVVQQIAVPR